MKRIELAEKLGMTVKEEAFVLEELFKADECFTSSSLKEIIPVVKIDDYVVGNGVPGDITNKLIDTYIANVEAECGLTKI